MKSPIVDFEILVDGHIVIPDPPPVTAKNHIAVAYSPVLPYRHRKASGLQRWIQRRKETRHGA